MITKKQLQNIYIDFRKQHNDLAPICGSILNKIHNKEIELKGEIEGGDFVVDAIKKEYKERLDELESFRQAGRDTHHQEECIKFMEECLLPPKISPEKYLEETRKIFSDFDDRDKKSKIFLLKHLQNKYIVNISDVIKLL